MADVTCQNCNGVGDVRWPSEDGGSPWLICPECDGTGKVPGTPPVEPPHRAEVPNG